MEGRATRMKVTGLHAWLISVPLAEPWRTRIAVGEWVCYKQDSLVVFATTDQGLTGYAAGPPSANLAQLINRNLRAAVVNTDPAKLETLRKKVFVRRPQFPGLAQAFAMVEAALIDLHGKIEGCPASKILGTPRLKRIRLVARSLGFLDSNQCEQEAAAAGQQGFGTYRFRLGHGWVGDREMLGRVRHALPSDCRMVADAQAWWQMGSPVYPEMERMAWVESLPELAPLWLAEPFQPGDLPSCEALVGRKAVPIASGEHEAGFDGLRMLAGHGVDVLQVNVMQFGGLFSGRSSLQALAADGRRFVLAGAATPLEVVALAQLASGFDDGVCVGVEWPFCSANPGSAPLAAELLKAPLEIEHGFLRLPEAPGLGVQVNEALVRRFPWKPGASSAVL